ncbi:hypothetical protein [Flavicella sediminum]|uniref:hypothetical protein n=1 Tax=Flavicella sediminum TaxID=2585141 RepID=UPI00111FD397|nr:hypothetical protein [Flavicella sediminum]
MKGLVSILCIAFFSITCVSAQSKNGLKGPAAKNYKPWKDKNKSSLVLVTQNTKQLKGPEAKNYKPWKDNSAKESEAYVVALDTKKRNLRSPEAKNYKPWKK